MPIRGLVGERMDVCAFVGVTPRGPVREPVRDETWRLHRPTIGAGRPRRRSVAVPVESFDEYRRIYGGFDGPGRLPFAVRSYFDQGGQRAWIVRIVHDYEDATADEGGVASSKPIEAATAGSGTFAMSARNEGSWGNDLTVTMGYVRRPISPQALEPGVPALAFEFGDAPPLGSTLRLRIGLREADPGTWVDEPWVVEAVEVQNPERTPGGATTDESYTSRRWVKASLSRALSGVLKNAELVEAEMVVDDGHGRREYHEQLALSPLHPRFVATVLCHESTLVWPTEDWLDADLTPDPALPILGEDLVPFDGGKDRYGDITPEDFFDRGWDPLSGDDGDGVTALAGNDEIATLVVPDLYHPETLEPPMQEPATTDPGHADFERCGVSPPESPTEFDTDAPVLAKLLLDPRLPDDLESIGGYQRRLVRFCETLRNFVVLLDVPPGLHHQQILGWRARVSSSHAAVYHPWLRLAQVARGGQAVLPVRLNPSAVAAGFIARSELRQGLSHAPANLIAAGVVDVEQRVSPSHHDQLHPKGINVFLHERDGVRLTAARTLSSDPRLRQLTVRRLMMMLRRTLGRQMQWATFEPNGPRLRAEIRARVRDLLRELFRAGAFRGNSEEEAFFVRCDETNNPRVSTDRGMLLCEIGVAPSEPLEFIVLELTRDGDGRVEVSS